MNRRQLEQLRNWFDKYVQSFRMDDPAHQRNLDIKTAHTQRVCEAILDIGQHQNLDENDLRLAESAALLHDVGRFEQYHTYRTYMDSKSVNHAKMGVRVLREHSVLDNLDREDAYIILCAVAYHNRLAIPSDAAGKCLLISRLLRDADKTDVYQVVTEYYQVAHESPNETIQLDLPDTPEISESVMEDVRSRHVVLKEHLRTLNDFKLLQMGWIYDIHFRRTFEIIRERGYLESILESMPDRPEIRELGRQLIADLHQFSTGSNLNPEEGIRT